MGNVLQMWENVLQMWGNVLQTWENGLLKRFGEVSYDGLDTRMNLLA